MARLSCKLGMLMGIFVVCCSSPENKQNGISYPGPGNNLTPRELSQAYCSSCHLYPEPDLLPKSVWEKTVLKNMGSRLGVATEGYDPLRQHSMYDRYVLQRSNIFPEQKLVTEDDWNKLVEFYLSSAPDSVQPQAPKKEIMQSLYGFRVKPVDNLPSQPLTTMLTIDTLNQLIYWGSRTGDLMVTDAQGQLKLQYSLESAPSDLLVSNHTNYVLTMGIMDPSEESKGSLISLQGRQQNLLLKELQRPVRLSIIDLDGNHQEDFLVSQFGNETGRLSWFSRDGKGAYQERIIKNVPGAVSTETLDFNHDGRMDVMALFGQGDERISIFLQTPESDFNEQILWRFPPVYGSSHFQLVDFNGDHKPDILYTNGDNADYSYSLKPYHGTRIFINNGDDHFEQVYFYPLYGATKSMARDFDQDGDMDVFSICFFPDFEADFPESFVYFENQGDLEFKPYTFPESKHGRWLVADAGDIDGDGDEDIVLGSFLHLVEVAPRELIKQWNQYGYHMVILENTLID